MQLSQTSPGAPPLAPRFLTTYLLERGLLPPGPVADGKLRVIETSSRHQNFRVRYGDEGLFVKQARPHDPLAIATLQREGCCYYLAAHDPSFAPLAALAPRFVDFDRTRHLLVVDLVTQAETLSQRFHRQRGLDESTARRLGERIGRYHRELSSQSLDPRFEAIFPGLVPWPLRLDQLPPHQFQNLGPAAVELVDHARRDPVLVAAARSLRADWRLDSLIHGDLKWDNVLASSGEAGREQLTLIDWELADRGDALWDVAGLLQSHLLVWLWSMPLEEGGDPTELVARSAAPIEEQRPAVRHLWNGYVEGRDFEPGEAEAALTKTLRLTAPRLLQAAFERAVAEGAVGSRSSFLLRAARHIFQHPENAGRHLGLLDTARGTGEAEEVTS